MNTIQSGRPTFLPARRRAPALALVLLGCLLAWQLAAPRPALPAPAAANVYQGADPAQWVAAPKIVYSSYLGGNSDDQSQGIARDAAGNLYVVGDTYSTDFGGSPSQIAGSDDIFVAKFDPSGKPLYRTLIGGKSTDTPQGIAVNAAGEVAVTAYTSSLDFPLRNPLVPTKPDYGGVVFKLDAAGQLAFSTFLNIDFSHSRQNIAFDKSGNMVFTGTDWAGATTGRENVGIYILKGDGSAPVQLGQFGGDWVEHGSSLAIGPDGKIYIAGMTHFRDGGFPLSENAFQKECGAKSYGASDPYCDDDAFVAVLNPEGNDIIAATYLGGEGSDDVYGVGVDNAGNVYVAGVTYSQNFPTKNAFQATWLGADNFSNGFITKFTPDLSAQVYSTFLASQDASSSDFIHAITVDGAGNLAATGLTNGQYFPTKNAVQNELDGRVCIGSSERYCHDAYVAAFDPSGALTFSTYLGGDDDDSAYAIVGDDAGGVWVTGQTEATDFAVTTDAAQPRAMMQSDAFLTRLGVGGTSGGGGGGQPTPKPFKVNLPLLHR